MRLLPWDYGVRNLLRRPLRTSLTAAGLGLVVFLVLLILSFIRGLEVGLQQSGEERVLLVHSVTAADNHEISSVSDRVPTLLRNELSALWATCGETPALSPELVTSSLLPPEREGGRPQLAVFRGVRPEVFLVRQKAFVAEGRFPKAGEVLVGRLAAAKLGRPAEDLAVGQTLVLEGVPRKIAGRFAAPGTLLEAEIWLPLDDLKQQAKRPGDVSLVAARLGPQVSLEEALDLADHFCRFRHRDLELMASPEVEYYRSLQRHYGPMRALAWLLVVLVGLAGACGAVNTMYAAVAGRVREFAALQAVGFSRRAIGLSLLQESVLLAAAATLAAAGLALVSLHGAAVRFTMGAFTLQLDRTALLVGCGAGVALGVLGALPPAARAFRLPVAAALKAV
jgi:ABC-type antimicrobial peptide transport system permease subunit